MARQERSQETKFNRIRKVAAIAGAATLMASAGLVAEGCGSTNYVVPNPTKTGETMVLNKDQYVTYQALMGATPTTGEAAGSTNPDKSANYLVVIDGATAMGPNGKPMTFTSEQANAFTSMVEGKTTGTTVFSATKTETTNPATATTEQSTGAEAGKVGIEIPVPSVISGDMVREVRNGGSNKMFTEGQWFHPVYDIGAETAANDYRGIGPWYPVAFANIDANAAQLTTHGNVGELVISTKNGGKVMIAVMQLDKHQTDGAWGTDPKSGKFMQNKDWAMQYNFHSLQPLQEIFVVNPDTGAQLTWPDGSPVIYRANEQGIAAFAIPKTHGNDVRVGFVFTVPAQDSGVQASEIKFERGPNDRPGKTGENLLPETILKPMVSEK